MIACSTVAFDGYDVTLAISKIGELGFDAVELGFIEGYVSDFSDELFGEESARRVRSALTSAGIGCAGVSGHIDLGERDAVERMRRRLDFAQEVGAPRLITNAAARSREAEFYRNIDRIAARAEDAGVVVCLENPGNGVPNVIDTGVAGAEVMQRIHHPFIRINYDFANTASHAPANSTPGFRTEADFTHAMAWLEQLHLKDVRRSAEGHFEYPALGEGEIDFPAVFRTLAELDVSPVFALEIPVRLRRHPDGSPYRLSAPVGIEETAMTLRASRDYVLSNLGSTAGGRRIGE